MNIIFNYLVKELKVEYKLHHIQTFSKVKINVTLCVLNQYKQLLSQVFIVFLRLSFKKIITIAIH